MKKIFIDSEIILDLLAKRETNYIYAAKLFTLIDQQKIVVYTSLIVFANLNYLLKKKYFKFIGVKKFKKIKIFFKNIAC